jgi:ADP-ribosylglycohydrolase
MLGAIFGDIVGSVHEHRATKSVAFPLVEPMSRMTDDTVLTIATAESILTGTDYGSAYRRWGRRYPRAGYGGSFRRWLADEGMGPYNSWGNGSAMRVSPIGWAFSTVDDVLWQAEESAAVTHDHPEGIRGARAVALAVFRARTGSGKDEIRGELTARFGYDLRGSVDEVRPEYSFDVSCQGSVPEAVLAFLEAKDIEDAVRLAISLGGDADTQAAIAGSIAEAHFGALPEEHVRIVHEHLPPDMLEVLTAFQEEFGFPGAGDQR